jgi:ssDNA-binding Zn-finger/Zn-ribbon topoisomerase 1
MRPFAESMGLDLTQRHAAFNDKKIGESAHYAIALTGMTGAMDADETKIYEIVRDTIAALFAPAWQYRAGTLRIMSGTFQGQPLIWHANGKSTINPGWKKILGGAEEEDDPESSLPEIPNGTMLTIPEGRLDSKKTTPPAHYTDDTLIKAMDNVHKVVDDPRAKAMLKEVSGIGTNATRATVLEELIDGKLLTRSKKMLLASPQGHTLIDSLESVGSPLSDPVLTASWEEKLADIAKRPPGQGESAYQTMIAEIHQAMHEWEKLKIKGQAGSECPSCHEATCLKFKSKTTGNVFWKCGACQDRFNDENGKPGRSYGPKGPQAGETCPKCGAGTVVRREGKKPGVFYWRCTSEGCGKNFEDENGKIGRCFDDPRPSQAGEICPKCKTPHLIRLEGKKPGVFYWRCTHEKCGKNFSDESGKVGRCFDDPRPTESGEVCPQCGAATVVRRESGKKPGVFYWRCTAPKCDTGFKDANGSLGDPFPSTSSSGSGSSGRSSSGKSAGGKSTGAGKKWAGARK